MTVPEALDAVVAELVAVGLPATRDAGEGRLKEAAQWLVPESVALMAKLAAKVATP